MIACLLHPTHEQSLDILLCVPARGYFSNPGYRQQHGGRPVMLLVLGGSGRVGGTSGIHGHNTDVALSAVRVLTCLARMCPRVCHTAHCNQLFSSACCSLVDWTYATRLCNPGCRQYGVSVGINVVRVHNVTASRLNNRSHYYMQPTKP